MQRARGFTARDRTRGFTLIEIMVVIVILGGLVGIVGINVIRQQKDADNRTARLQMASFGGAVKMYYLTHRRLPERLEQLLEPEVGTGDPYLDALPDDPWETPYEYERLGSSRFRIISSGRDRLVGTDDDLVWPGAVKR